MSFDLLDALGGDEATAALFTSERSISDWLAVEAALAHGMAAGGLIDRETAERIATACRPDVIDVESLWSEAETVGYPILPLVRMICAALPSHEAGFVHFGATTQDIMDTALALQLRDAGQRLLELLAQVGDALAVLVDRHSGTVMAGRTHAQQAVPTTFGAKMAVFLDEFTRHRARLEVATDEVAVLSLFGAGGTSAAMMAALGSNAEAVRIEVAERLDLSVALVPWHVGRDRLADLAMAAAMACGTCIRLAREVVDLSRSEIGEVAEMDGLYRGASSTMPQKANPITAEMIIGFGVIAQNNASALLRAMEAGHERSAGEWQIEWHALPSLFRAAAGALKAAAVLATGLRVFPERMAANLELDGGRIMAEAYMIWAAAEIGRDQAHDVMYRAVRESRELDQPLVDTLRESLSPELWTVIGPRLPSPRDYLGNTGSVCAAALQTWRSGGSSEPRDEDRSKGLN